MTCQKMRNSPQPSILAASESSLGMVRKNCLSRNTLKALAKNDPTQSGWRMFEPHPRDLNSP